MNFLVMVALAAERKTMVFISDKANLARFDMRRFATVSYHFVSIITYEIRVVILTTGWKIINSARPVSSPSAVDLVGER